MQVATFEANPLCIMQRMPPLLASATPHPSPETNHCRAPACTAPPPPSRAARRHGAAPAAARRPLKGGRRPFEAAGGGARRSAAARSPQGARGAGPSLRGAQRGPGSPALRPPPGAAFLFRRRLREPGAPGALWERRRPVLGRRRRARSAPVSARLGEGGRDARLKGEYRPAGPGRPCGSPSGPPGPPGAVHGGARERCLQRGRAGAWWGRFKKEAPPAPPPPRGPGKEGGRGRGRSGGGGRRRRRRG